MIRQNRPSASAGYQSVDQDYDALLVLIRRLSTHRGYDREALTSPMLKRLMPTRRPSGDAAAETAELRKRLTAAGLDRKALVYLAGSAATELDYARQRLS